MSKELQSQLAALTKTYQKLQTDFSQAVEARQRLDAQKAENEAVKKEFAALAPENKVYKLVGPVLVAQEQDEAKANVANRLELISGEITKVEKQLTDFETKLEEKKMEIVHIQTQLQQQASSSSGEGGKS